jgi:N-acetylneuraminate lyase
MKATTKAVKKRATGARIDHSFENRRLTGLVAATHTPFHDDGTLRLEIVEKQAAHLLANGIRHVFIGGTTGESHSLTTAERMQLAKQWLRVARGTDLFVVVHVGTNCLADARALAEQAGRLGAAAIAALAPSFFKPANVDALVACCAEIAGAAPTTPFYFYDIPSMTGVSIPMPEFLERAGATIPTFAGLKFTNPDMISYQLCLNQEGGRFDLPWGIDECLLAALSFGAKGAVGSTYNFAAPLYHRLIDAFQRHDFAAARMEQLRSVQLVKVLVKRGYMGSAKALMGMLGVDVGPARLPNARLSAAQIKELRNELETLGFFQWIQP